MRARRPPALREAGRTVQSGKSSWSAHKPRWTCKLRAVSSPLSQDLAAKIIDVLLQRGHVLLSKGGRPALVREIADRTNDTLATIVGRLPPPGIVEDEVTSTFGDEALDDTVEEMVEDVTASLMDSDHVEDVFSEDAVIRRDVFRVVKDTLLASRGTWAENEEAEADVEVALESLGYIAAKAAQRGSPSVVEGALRQAGKGVHAKLVRYSPETRTAMFRAALASPDARLELEEAVADELCNLVDDGKVALPTIERRISLGRPVSAKERSLSRALIDEAADKTLLPTGCTYEWELEDDGTLHLSLVPMSEQDGRGIDPHVEAFARRTLVILNRDRAPEPAAKPAKTGIDAWLALARSGDGAGPPAKRSSPPKAAAEESPASEKAPAKKKTKAEPSEEGTAAKKVTTSKKAVAKKAAPKAKAAAEKPAKAAAEKPAKATAEKAEKSAKPRARRS